MEHNEYKVQGLFDTGSPLTILNAADFNEFSTTREDVELVTLNGTKLRTYGQQTVLLVIEGREILHNVVVADITIPCVVGWDLISRMNIVIQPRQPRRQPANMSTEDREAILKIVADAQTDDPHIKKKLEELVMEYAELFTSSPPLAPVPWVHRIQTGNATPIKKRPARLSEAKKQRLRKEVNRLLAEGIIRPSNSPWASRPILIIRDGKADRLVIDYRDLNLLTIKDAYGMPLVEEIFDSMAGAQYVGSRGSRENCICNTRRIVRVHCYAVRSH